MSNGTKIAIGVAGAACVLAGVALWALADLCEQLNRLDFQYDYSKYR